MARDVVQSSSESLVMQTLPWAQMSSQDQYGITAPQIQTLTLHYVVPLPVQAMKRETDREHLQPNGVGFSKIVRWTCGKKRAKLTDTSKSKDINTFVFVHPTPFLL